MDRGLATSIQGVVIDCHIFEMIDDIQFLYDVDCIDIFMFGEYDEFIDAIYDYKYESQSVNYIDDIINEMRWWSCFEQSEEERKRKIDLDKLLEKEIFKEFKKPPEKPKKKKIGRNDACPCGSGKKYKKCCMDKTLEDKGKNFIESDEERKKWLKHYPIEEGEKKDGQILITDVFDKESINIDKLVYLALHHRAFPIWIKRDYKAENRNKIAYLTKAGEQFLSKCEKENITSFEEYDSKYKIHYRSSYWFQEFKSLLQENDLEEVYKDTIEEIEKITAKFS